MVNGGLFSWKNRRGGEESAYGTAAEIAVSQTQPLTCACAIGRLTFRTEVLRSIDRALSGEA